MSGPFSFDLGTTHRPCAAYMQRRLYLSTGWRHLLTWDGLSGSPGGGIDPEDAIQEAGLEGPSQETGAWTPTPTPAAASGSAAVTEGDHLVRYRYRNSQNGAVSNPSSEYTLAADGTKKYTFAIDDAGATKIIRSTQFLADQIVLESTLADTLDGTFYEVARVAMTEDEVVFTLSDVELARQRLTWDDAEDPYPGLGHSLPPVKRYVLAHRGRLWAYGEVIHDDGTATVTHDSQAITGAGSPGWTEDALGTEDDPPIAGRRFFAIPGQEGTVYEILERVSATELLVRRVSNVYGPGYGAASQSGVSYQIVSRDTQIYFSRAGFPESWPPDNALEIPSTGLSGQVMAGVGYGADLLFFCEHGAYRFLYDIDPRIQGQFLPIPGSRGAYHQGLVFALEGRVYAFDSQGPWVYEGGEPIDLSGPITEELGDLDRSRADEWCAVYIPDANAIRFYVTLTGDDSEGCTYYLQLSLEKRLDLPRAWSTGRVDQAVTCVALVPYQANAGEPSQLVPVLGDALGHSWYADQGTMDGGTSATRELTVAAGGSASDVHTEETLPISNAGLGGVAVTWKEGGETRLVQQNEINLIVLDEAFSSAPAEGDTLWLGRIRGKLRTKTFWPARDGHGNLQGRWLICRYTPTDEVRRLLVRVYEDNDASAKTWADADDYPTGPQEHVSPPGSIDDYAATDWVVDLSDDRGWFKIPLGAADVHCLQVELEVNEPDTPLEVWDIQLVGVSSEAV